MARGTYLRDTRFLRACTVEMHMDMSHEPFWAESYSELAGHGWYHLHWTPGLNCCRKNPSSVATQFGELYAWNNLEYLELGLHQRCASQSNANTAKIHAGGNLKLKPSHYKDS